MHGPHHEFTWWKNSDTVSKLGLNDSQVKQLDQTFTQHKMKLIDDTAAMQKADLTLHSLLDADSPDQSQVMAAVDQVLAARGTVERETTMMMLDMRKVLTVDQWKQLRAMHPMGPGFGGHGGPRAMHHGKRGGGPNSAPSAPPDGGSPQQD
jgi:Spy/CpxP family protein refolding chaperone